MPAIATDVMGSLAYIAQYFKKKKSIYSTTRHISKLSEGGRHICIVVSKS